MSFNNRFSKEYIAWSGILYLHSGGRNLGVGVSRFVDCFVEASSDDAHNRIWYAYASYNPLCIEKSRLFHLGLYLASSIRALPRINSRNSLQRVPQCDGDH